MDRPASVLGRFRGALGTTVRIVLGLLIIVLSPFVPTLLALPWWLGFFTFVVGMVLIYSFAGTREFDVWDWGIRHSVEQRAIDDEELVYCDACGQLAAGGVMRRYAKQIAFLGSPIKTLDWGGNIYCEDCATGTPGTEAVVVPSTVEVSDETNDGAIAETDGNDDPEAIPGTSD